MGRQTKVESTDLAYIAGFLDGDGSIMIQLKKRSDTSLGKRMMFTICFYQDTRHEKPLFWMKKIFGIGYISRRSDGITELRINGYERVQKILEELYPYIRFKKKQVKHIFVALEILRQKKISQLTLAEKKKISSSLISARKETYQSGQKKIEKLKTDLKEILQL
ncbi:MAG: LAGLIDADG family homing endonuclease [Candidatus Paceibacterota bacterium]